jgi:hypothetical protein
MNALIRPFKEIVAFLSCEWPTEEGIPRVSPEANTEKDGTADESEKTTVPDEVLSRGFQLKLVAHYPRVFFLADENDPHSRALVLRG